MRVGDRIEVRGVVCEVFKVHPLGTVDVVSLCGRYAFRVSGLPFKREGNNDERSL